MKCCTIQRLLLKIRAIQTKAGVEITDEDKYRSSSCRSEEGERQGQDAEDEEEDERYQVEIKLR